MSASGAFSLDQVRLDGGLSTTLTRLADGARWSLLRTSPSKDLPRQDSP